MESAQQQLTTKTGNMEDDIIDLISELESCPMIENDENLNYKDDASNRCQICFKIFKTKGQLNTHKNKHNKKCRDCKLKLKSWFDENFHRDYCSKTNRIIIPIRDNLQEIERRRPWKCCLCHRSYEKYKQLFDHQVKRCKKRYVSHNWIVKI